ncbi:MAG TPA: AMP-binding protein, partial [Candidatus Eisenbacteria bacterium]|nr:AMP-binding protein [Candidatus Eisenbacteria bacterium]
MPKTLIRIFLDTVERHPRPDRFMRHRENGWEKISAERALADVESLALGLADLGVKRGDRVALLSENRYEWPICDLAILGQGALTVPVYPTLTAAQVRYIVADAGACVAIVSSAAQRAKLLGPGSPLPDLWAVVVMDEGPDAAPGDRTLAAV